MMSKWFSKHVRHEIYLFQNKFWASIWLITKISILRCTVSKTSKMTLTAQTSWRHNHSHQQHDPQHVPSYCNYSPNAHCFTHVTTFVLKFHRFLRASFCSPSSLIPSPLLIPIAISLPWRNSPQWTMASSLSGIHDHTTVGRTSLYEGSARRRDLYLTTHNSQQTQQTDTDSNPRSH